MEKNAEKLKALLTELEAAKKRIDELAAAAKKILEARAENSARFDELIVLHKAIMDKDASLADEGKKIMDEIDHEKARIIAIKKIFQGPKTETEAETETTKH